jgi:hypothetical protein
MGFIKHVRIHIEPSRSINMLAKAVSLTRAVALGLAIASQGGNPISTLVSTPNDGLSRKVTRLSISNARNTLSWDFNFGGSTINGPIRQVGEPISGSSR